MSVGTLVELCIWVGWICAHSMLLVIPSAGLIAGANAISTRLDAPQHGRDRGASRTDA